MGYTWRTDGPWGPGVSRNLLPAEVDNNFWQAIQDIKEKAPQGVGISNFVVSGGNMTVVMTDHTLHGPYKLPMMQLVFFGEWEPNTPFNAGTIITHGGSTYIVEVNHTSAATFDPYANDGMGNDYYGLLLQNPASTMPAGGAAGAFLRKVTSVDYVMRWEGAALDELSDVAIAAPANGEILTYQSGVWQNLGLTFGLDALTDVTITSPADGQVLTYSGTDAAWEGKAISLALSGLTDVSMATPPVAGQPLVFDGTKWVDARTVDMPCGGINVVSGSLTLDRSAGEVQRLALSSTVTITNIIGWPPGGQFARLVLEVQNSGSFGLAFPNGVLWPSGIKPTMTPNGKDIFIFVSFDGGTTIYGNIGGQAYA